MIHDFKTSVSCGWCFIFCNCFMYTVAGTCTWIYSSVQFVLVVLFAHLFYSMVSGWICLLKEKYGSCICIPSIRNFVGNSSTDSFFGLNLCLSAVSYAIYYVSGTCDIYWVCHYNVWEFHHCWVLEMENQVTCVVLKKYFNQLNNHRELTTKNSPSWAVRQLLYVLYPAFVLVLCEWSHLWPTCIMCVQYQFAMMMKYLC